MSTVDPNDLAEVLARVAVWPVADRIALVKRILESLTPPTSSTAPIRRGRSASEIIESISTDRPAPDDETIRQRIDEHRMEKYG
jgi:hypothetical protein